MHDIYIYIYVRGAHGETLVGRNHIGAEILMSALQPMKRFWKMSQSQKFAVLWVLWVLPSQQKLRVLMGDHLSLHLGL